MSILRFVAILFAFTLFGCASGPSDNTSSKYNLRVIEGTVIKVDIETVHVKKNSDATVLGTAASGATVNNLRLGRTVTAGKFMAAEIVLDLLENDEYVKEVENYILRDDRTQENIHITEGNMYYKGAPKASVGDRLRVFIQKNRTIAYNLTKNPDFDQKTR